MDHQDIPQHIPVQAAVAPEQKPYQQKHIVRTPSISPPPPKSERRISQHSLSPEKLGVVGYVKDVAGFVKDVVQDRKEKKNHKETGEKLIEGHEEERKTPRSPSPEPAQQQQQQHKSTPLAEAVTGLFPIDHGCIHADDLRQQMMQVNEQERKLL